MLLKIESYSRVPIYVQIENHIRFAIASGKLAARERLPSVRELSERLNVNPNTVAKAYRDLQMMGLLYTRHGMGIYVAKGVLEECQQMCRKRVSSRLHEVMSEAKAMGMMRTDVMAVFEKSMTLEGDPYAQTPGSILGLLKETRAK